MRKESALSRLIPVTELDPSTFSAFGTVIQNPTMHDEQPALNRVVANQGTATKWLDVTHMTNYYEGAPSKKPAKVSMNMFVCKPRKLHERQGKLVFLIEILERHPFTPQTFIPLGVSPEDNDRRYLVIVAPTLTTSSPREYSGPPDLDNVQAFIANGDQAVTYGAGTWHAPMVVLGEREIEFVVVQYVNGVATEDCQEIEVGGYLAADTTNLPISPKARL